MLVANSIGYAIPYNVVVCSTLRMGSSSQTFITKTKVIALATDKLNQACNRDILVAVTDTDSESVRLGECNSRESGDSVTSFKRGNLA